MDPGTDSDGVVTSDDSIGNLRRGGLGQIALRTFERLVTPPHVQKILIFSSVPRSCSLFSMPRVQKSHYHPPELELICPVEGCGKECRSYGGLTQHFQAKHPDSEYQPGTSSAPAVNDFIVLDSDYSSANDLDPFPPENDPDGPLDAFGSESNLDLNSIGFDFENPFLPSSRPDSPSRESEPEASYMHCHPIINGLLYMYIQSSLCEYSHFYTR